MVNLILLGGKEHSWAIVVLMGGKGEVASAFSQVILTPSPDPTPLPLSR